MDFTKPHPLLATPGKKLLPVIHVLDFEQTMRNVDVAFENGADGVFLINHNFDGEHLLDIHAQIRRERPDGFIGLNLLDRSATQAFEAVKDNDSVSALWVDDSGVDEGGYSQAANSLYDEMVKSDWRGAYFASIAFKHQRPVTALDLVTALAVDVCHALVTSGEATGSAPPQEKLRTIQQALDGLKPLANASGTSLDNVSVLGPHADIFMVATGINQDDDFYNLNPARVRIMADLLHKM